SLYFLSLLMACMLWTTNTQATTCGSATLITPASLPISGQSVVCGGTNDITYAATAASVKTTGCNSSSYYGGQEALYVFTPTSSGLYHITLTGQTWTMIMVTLGCPTTAGSTCVGGVTGSGSTKNIDVTLTAGLTYYIMFDTWPTPNSPCPGTFSLTPPPACGVPTSPVGTPTTATTANISWTAPVPAPSNGYEYAVTTSATPPASGTFFAGTSTSVSGLTPTTTYYLHVRSDCGSNGYSTWATSSAFTTPCNPSSLPWTENFDGVTVPAFPSCWKKENGDWGTTNNSSSSFDADARSGTQFLRDAYSATNEYMWTPGFTMTAGNTYEFKFWWAGDNYSGWTGDVFVNSAQNSSGATQL